MAKNLELSERILKNSAKGDYCVNELPAEEEESSGKKLEDDDILYPVDSRPAIHIIMLYSFQIALITSAGGTVIMYLVYSNICATDDVVFAQLVATSTFWSGISGGIVSASAVQVVLGFTGAIGILMRFIGPLTIVPTLSLLSLSLCVNVINTASKHFGVAAMSMCLFLTFMLFLYNRKVPYPVYSKSKGWHFRWYAVFRIFALVLSIVISWLVCFLLTWYDVFPSNPNEPGYHGRVDAKYEVIEKVQWFYVPYPGHTGLPSFSAGMFLGMLAATVASIVESISTYRMTAAVCNVAPPPAYAINRAILTDGILSGLCGFLKMGIATTPYSATVGHIAYSGMGSRLTWIGVGVVMILMGVFTKFGAALATIPDPILAGLSLPSLGMLMTGMILSVSLSNLKHVDMGSTRNLMILGITHMMGIGVPAWIASNPNAITTGSTVADGVIQEYLSSPMFIGCTVGFLLDNIAPGNRAMRGFPEDVTLSRSQRISEDHIYAIPCLRNQFSSLKLCRYIPIARSFRKDTVSVGEM